MSIKAKIAFIVTLLVCIGIFAWMNRTIAPTPAPKPIVLRDDINLVKANWDNLVAASYGGEVGNASAPYTMIEFGDFQCPQCGRAHKAVDAVVQGSKGQLKLYFFNCPLVKLHKFAQSAALAGIAAAHQGKFWPMYDALYNGQDHLNDNGIQSIAQSISGMDMTKFVADWRSPATASELARDVALDKAVDIEVTPTFMLRMPHNGKVVRYVGTFGQHTGTVYPGLSDLMANNPWNATYGPSVMPQQPPGH